MMDTVSVSLSTEMAALVCMDTLLDWVCEIFPIGLQIAVYYEYNEQGEHVLGSQIIV